MKIEIRTDDQAFANRHAQGRDGRVVVDVTEAQRTTFAGREMVAFRLTDVPRDWPNANGLSPAAWVI